MAPGCCKRAFLPKQAGKNGVETGRKREKTGRKPAKTGLNAAETGQFGIPCF